MHGGASSGADIAARAGRGGGNGREQVRWGREARQGTGSSWASSLSSNAAGGSAAWRQEDGVDGMGGHSGEGERVEYDRGGPPVRFLFFLHFSFSDF